MRRMIFTLFLLLCANSTLAYIGPGAGISVLGSLLGILVTIGLAMVAIIMWPIRKMMKKRKAAATAETTDSADTNEQA